MSTDAAIKARAIEAQRSLKAMAVNEHTVREVPADRIGLAWRDAAGRAARWAALDLKLAVRVRWYDEPEQATRGFACPNGDVWVNRAVSASPADVAYTVLHEARHVKQYADGATTPDDIARLEHSLAAWRAHPLEQDAQAYARMAVRRLDLASTYQWE